MTDGTKHPMFAGLVELHVAVLQDIKNSVAVSTGQIALHCLQLERAMSGMPAKQWGDCYNPLDDLKNTVATMHEDCAPHDDLIKALASGFAEAADRVARAEARADCHPLNDKEVRQKVWELTSGRCTYCDCQLENGGTVGASFVVEHVVPRSCGGPDNIANYVPSCASCNNSKGDRHVLQFIQTKMDRRRPPLVVVPVAVASGE